MIRGRTWKIDALPGETKTPLEDERALFLRFADLPLDEKRILEFARDYGHLGIDHPIKLGTQPRTGEALEDWEREIACMRDAVTVWQRFTENDTSWLKKHICWVPAPQAQAVRRMMKTAAVAAQTGSADLRRETLRWARMQELWYDSHPQLNPAESPEDGIRFRRRLWWEFAVPEIRELIPRGDVRRPALIYAQWVINEKMTKHVRPELLWQDPNDPSPVIRLHPSNLLGAMWLQFAQAVEGGYEYIRCGRARCQKWTKVDARAKRRKKWCSKSCQVMASRSRSQAGKTRHASPRGRKPKKGKSRDKK